MIELVAIAALGFLRRLQGRNLEKHSLREFLNKLVIRLAYVIIITLSFNWDYWWNGAVWGLFIGFFYLNAWHEYGDGGWDAVKRYGPAGLFYPFAYYILVTKKWFAKRVYVKAVGFDVPTPRCWSCVGEIGLGAGVGIYTYLVSIIL